MNYKILGFSYKTELSFGAPTPWWQFFKSNRYYTIVVAIDRQFFEIGEIVASDACNITAYLNYIEDCMGDNAREFYGKMIVDAFRYKRGCDRLEVKSPRRFKLYRVTIHESIASWFSDPTNEV